MPKEKAIIPKGKAIIPPERTRRHSEGERRQKNEDRMETRKREEKLQHSSYNTKQRSSRHTRDIEGEELDYKPRKESSRFLEAQRVSKVQRYDEKLRKEPHEARVKQRQEDFTEQRRLGYHLKSKTARDTDPRMSKSVEYGHQKNKDRPTTKHKERPESDPEEVELKRRASKREKQRSLVTKERTKLRVRPESDPENMDDGQWRTSTRERHNAKPTKETIAKHRNNRESDIWDRERKLSREEKQRAIPSEVSVVRHGGRRKSDSWEVKWEERDTSQRVNQNKHRGESRLADKQGNRAGENGGDQEMSKELHRKSKRVVEEKESEEQDMDWQEEQQVETDPQEVPRKGFFYEHDNRDTYVPQRLRTVPPWRSQWLERKDFLEKRRFLDHPNPRTWRDREDHDWGHDGGGTRDRFRRHSSGSQYFTAEGGGGRGRRGGARDYEDWEDREPARMELVSSRWSGERRRRVDRQVLDSDDRKDRSPNKWKHDLFEQNSQTVQTAAGEEKETTGSSGVDGMWGHDKYEEIINMEDKTEPAQSSQ